MSNKIEEVHKFFNKTDNYLFSKSTIMLRKKIVSELLNGITNKEIIDIGCGSGDISIPFLESNKVTFIDISQNMLNETKKNISHFQIKNAEFYNTSIENFINNKNYDCVLLIGVLAHVQSLENCISKISEITNEGGICIIQITDNDKFIAKSLRIYAKLRKSIFKSSSGYESNILNKKIIMEIFLKYGYYLIEKRSYLPTLPGFKFLSQKSISKYLIKTYKTKLASVIGSEIILKFKKSTN